jgi:outer membrane protein OmpA-like peptidoglycan-associated protein
MQYKSDPLKVDTDGDGLNDYAEVMQYKSDPLKVDTDGDGLNDYVEVMQYKSDPLKVDTDGDGLNDYVEVMQYKTDPLKVDTDGDGLNDYVEVMQYKTDPLKVDTDGDGLNDYAEVMETKTDPLKVDTDGDGLNDYEEVTQYKTNPLVKDTDGGSVDDGKEVAEGKNPLDPKDDVMDLHAGATFSLEGILFETGKSTILQVSIPILEQAYAALAANPEVKVLIIGHTDSVGSESSNQTLSDNRANSVRTWLINRGIAANRLRAMGKGESQPRATNDTPEGRAQNRRIEFEIE